MGVGSAALMCSVDICNWFDAVAGQLMTHVGKRRMVAGASVLDAWDDHTTLKLQVHSWQSGWQAVIGCAQPCRTGVAY